MALVAAALIFPFTPLAKIFGFVSLPMSFLMILAIIIVLYILTAELAKKIFYQKISP
jgi:Mg2+-importing ATPase